MLNCQNCQKDLKNSKLENYQEEKDLLLCIGCYWKEAEKYKDKEVGHFPLLKRNGEVDGSEEAVVVWDFKKFKK